MEGKQIWGGLDEDYRDLSAGVKIFLNVLT